MAGNSQRRGARRKTGSKKGATVGSGGQARRSLKGKGPTPKATERTGHAAKRRADATKRAAERTPARSRGGAPRRAGVEKDTAELIAGRNSVVEALRADVPATKLYVADRIESDDRVKESLKLAMNRGLPLLEVSRAELDRLSQGAFHQGLLLHMPAYEYAHHEDLLGLADDAGEAPLIVALDGVTDPRNLGAVIRSAAAFGVHGVVVPSRRAAGMTAGAWKSSAGAAARVPVARATNLTRALDDYREAGVFVAGLAADGQVELGDFDMAADPLVLVVGSEGKGLSRLVASVCDVRVSIPMAGGSESLNAGVAAGIALYEIARARA